MAVTTQRLLIMVDGEIIAHELHGGIHTFQPVWEEYSVLLHPTHGAPIHLYGPAVPYAGVLLHTLLHRRPPYLPGQELPPPSPPRTRQLPAPPPEPPVP